MKLRRIP